MLSAEATKVLQRLADLSAQKQQKPYSAVMRHLRLRLSITLVKAVHHCLRGSRKKRPPINSRSGFLADAEPTEPSPEFRILHD
jgi:hypothetical protein